MKYSLFKILKNLMKFLSSNLFIFFFKDKKFILQRIHYIYDYSRTTYQNLGFSTNII